MSVEAIYRWMVQIRLSRLINYIDEEEVESSSHQERIT